MAKAKKITIKKNKQPALSAKIGKIMTDGVRKNTKRPVSKSNPRRKVSQKQAVAIAYSMMGNKKMKSAHKKAMKMA